MKKFKKIYIEITNICNLSCNFCPKTRRYPQFMNRDLFVTIINQIKERAEFVYFHIMGEPLLHPEINEFLGICKDNNLKVNITTNGTLIEKEFKNIIDKTALRQVNFSLHSFEANNNLILMDNYLNDILKFIDQTRIKSNIQIVLRLWNQGEGRNEKNFYIINKIENHFDLKFSILDKLNNSNGVKLIENVYLNQAEKFDWPEIEKENIDEVGFCQGLRNQIGFLVDGTVVPCCLDSEGTIKLGNIKNENLEDILNSERSKNFFRAFSNRKIPEELCKKCGYRVRFSGK